MRPAMGGNKMQIDLNDVIFRFFRDDISGILVTNAAGAVLYSDEKSAFVKEGNTNWRAACPPVRQGQKSECWDLLDSATGKTYMALTSTVLEAGEMLQVHHLTDTSLYTGLYRDITDYSKALKQEKEHDDR